MEIITDLDRKLEQWAAAEVIDTTTAERIRRFEKESRRGSDFLVRIALLLGGIMIAGGVLLFVAAHWDKLSPSQRFILVLLMVSVFHVAGAISVARWRVFSVTMHALGTVSLGAGIFLAGQIFNLAEHWPGAFLLWSIGALAAWFVLRHSIQAIFASVLVPIWVGGEWVVRTEHYYGGAVVEAAFLTMLALAYFTSTRGDERQAFHKAVRVLGGIVLLPACATLAAVERGPSLFFYLGYHRAISVSMLLFGWALALALPVLFYAVVRRSVSIKLVIAALWILALGQLDYRFKDQELAIYAWCALGTVALIAWGLKEMQQAYINVGVIGFAVTVIAFYFSNVMDKLGRSFALILFGVLFIVGGFLLERVRRRLVAQVAGGVA